MISVEEEVISQDGADISRAATWSWGPYISYSGDAPCLSVVGDTGYSEARQQMLCGMHNSIRLLSTACAVAGFAESADSHWTRSETHKQSR
jgi:hypothetical protein